MVKVYGIPNCSSVKKALDWLKQHDIEFEFHDYKKVGIDKKKLKEWSDRFGWEKVLNKKGTTWRKLSPEEQEKVTSEKAALTVMAANPSMIKRPVVEKNNDLLIGFDENEYTVILDPKSTNQL
ncbi:ArsC family reductase [Aridibaculum aurantiacum]|uniref:ArsC family reductase n=1 Tax=Aridibaculum aurantiacum TaxID=2810307 RepID=UPI001A9796B5|nr:ArsC family reductase [Aridibaculum aurantiacum]